MLNDPGHPETGNDRAESPNPNNQIMDNYQVARILHECGTLLELQGENPFRCLSYHNAARALEQLDEDLETLVANGELAKVRGIGQTLVQKISTLVTTGQLEFYDQLRAKVPPGLIDMLRIQGLGPKKIKAVYDQLGVESVADLKAASSDGRVAKLKGFGPKTAVKILAGIEFLDRTGRRYRLDEALRIAQAVYELVCDHPRVIRAELCGSLRRRRETIKDVDLLVSAEEPGAIMDRFVSLPGVMEVVAKGETKSSIVLEPGIGADLRVVSDAEFPFALHYFTGSKAHNVRMRARAQDYGLKLNEYGLVGPKQSLRCKDESDIFAVLDLDYIAPELREDSGEIEAARAHQLPRLLEPGDLKGTFHCHTDWSDGSATLEEMARAAKRIGYKYLGIADHSQTAAYAGGLSPGRVLEQLEAIDSLNTKIRGLRLFKGTESDILPDGRLDYSEELLAQFDYVVASVHSSFTMSRDDMTRRIIRAVSHPRCTMLGHPTGRLLLRRDGYSVDLDAVIDACREHGTMIEINANPMRLDLDAQHCRRAKAKGIKIVINPDAHSTGGLGDVCYGVDVARRGWLEPANVVNTRGVAQVCKLLQR